ncbi:MAG: hypothetical protein ACRDXD_08575 [Acidimicrobiia bacterium]
MPAELVEANGRPAPASGHWVDGHGHRVFSCRGDLLPACPKLPHLLTRWRLARPVPCRPPSTRPTVGSS